jgi:superfamily II DNA/RNA helicase
LSAPILAAVADLGYKTPTDIQQQTIPAVLLKKDIIAAAQTGSGKTASYVLPLLEHQIKAEPLKGKRINTLILVPTRELAVQVEANIANYSQHTNISSMAMYGGIEIEPQKQRLIWGIDILVATPGRLLDMAHQRAVHFDQLQTLVLDEADRMLDMGFIDDINKIVERLPKLRQNLLFSATLSNAVRALAKRTLNSDAIEVLISTSAKAKAKIQQWLVTVDKDKKSALLSFFNQRKTLATSTDLYSNKTRRGKVSDSIS